MTPIYHITHVRNLAGIVQTTRLWSDSQRIKQDFPCVNIGYQHIKERRRRRVVPVAANGMLSDYVPFNFCNRSVMLYVISQGHINYDGGQSPVVHLVSSVETAIATGRRWAFTDRHAELGYANYFDNWSQKDRINWSVMPMRIWTGDERREQRQAEFLVHDWFPWKGIERIGVHDSVVAEQVKRILESSPHKPSVSIQRDWYY